MWKGWPTCFRCSTATTGRLPGHHQPLPRLERPSRARERARARVLARLRRPTMPTTRWSKRKPSSMPRPLPPAKQRPIARLRLSLLPTNAPRTRSEIGSKKRRRTRRHPTVRPLEWLPARAACAFSRCACSREHMRRQRDATSAKSPSRLPWYLRRRLHRHQHHLLQ